MLFWRIALDFEIGLLGSCWSWLFQVSKHNLHRLSCQRTWRTRVFLLPWVKGKTLENEILGFTVACFKYAQTETLLKFHSCWNCRRAPQGRSHSALLSAGTLSASSTWSYFSGL